MKAKKLSISLPTDSSQTIRAAVSTGACSSNSEVIREATRLWQEHHADREQRLAAVRAKMREAIGDPAHVTDDELGLAEAEK